MTLIKTMVDRFKQILRKSYKQVRSHLPATYQNAASEKVCARINRIHQYRYAKKIALYHAVQGEIDLERLWRSAPYQGKFCYFPVLNENLTLSFLPATPATTFKPNRFNIPEPDVSRELAIPVNELDIIFMPLVAFDDMGTRLGMGAGYYDRTLAEKKHSLLIGVAYDFQHEGFLSVQSWDIPLTAVVTPKKLYWSQS
nr:5-formyltetrahydrofolate cyclo-ligase [Legionella israelensis]